MKKKTDLSIKGESIQSVYGDVLKKMYSVNRRYQRKLIWTVDEKISFIDSILKGYPIPLILIAASNNTFEIIDGMQRLNAIISFIEQEFDIEGEYFDLDTMADTKYLKDQLLIEQKTPVLDRQLCAEFARYTLPISVFEESNGKNIDEVFRRLNSGGRHLSRQELRQAGSLSDFSNIVRKIASNIRGDSSATDILDLKSMQLISINNKKLNYGINVDDIFWVKNNIIRRDKLRESQDEEVIADILAWCTMEDGIRSSSDILDLLYEHSSSSDVDTSIANSIGIQINKIGKDQIINDIQYIFDYIVEIIESLEDKNLKSLLFKNNKESKISRHFQILFYALYELMICENLQPISIKKVVRALKHSGDKVMKLSGGGGNWSQKEKQTQTEALLGILRKCFIPKKDSKDVATTHWISRLENLLTQSSIEQTMYDFKIGFCELGKKEIDQNTVSKVIKTLTSMANTMPEGIGYCIIGVADNQNSANKHREIYSSEYIEKYGFYITGIQNEANITLGNIDKYYNRIIQMIKSEPISDRNKDYISRNLVPVKYYNQDLLIFKIEADTVPSIYDDNYYVRHGSNVTKVEPIDFPELMKRFL